MIKNEQKKKRDLENDLELLEYLTNHEVKQAAVYFKTTEPAIRAWLNRLRKRIVKMRDFLTRVRTLQRKSDRVKKFTTIGSIPIQEEEIY
jgi:hypothetical protein